MLREILCFEAIIVTAPTRHKRDMASFSPKGGGRDVFVHISEVERAGFTSLVEGAKVRCEIKSDRSKESAANLSVG